ncbi:beta-glucan synthesis-associated protein KRE6 [Histoplasma capsulatum]|uniref:Beta-glucan synthesis-associated protein KRE6 n=1 Tax=Ajellomyces capsulatus TaxID=5037 RepID=A0A8A1M597_AJECA|nr:beta-glucan synthesis-associated protein KRE6 [Histoplasma capsulatum]
MRGRPQTENTVPSLLVVPARPDIWPASRFRPAGRVIVAIVSPVHSQDKHGLLSSTRAHRYFLPLIPQPFDKALCMAVTPQSACHSPTPHGTSGTKARVQSIQSHVHEEQVRAQRGASVGRPPGTLSVQRGTIGVTPGQTMMSPSRPRLSWRNMPSCLLKTSWCFLRT